VRELVPSATLSTTNPTWIDLGLCSERLVTNRLSHDMAFNNTHSKEITKATNLYFGILGWLYSKQTQSPSPPQTNKNLTARRFGLINHYRVCSSPQYNTIQCHCIILCMYGRIMYLFCLVILDDILLCKR
jgi:hypothetical protein